jgi:hypothetical protein
MNDTATDYEGLLENQSKLAQLNKRAREIKHDIKRYGQYLADVEATITEGAGYGDAANRERCRAMYTADVAKAQAALAEVEPKIAALEACRPEVSRYTEILQGLKGNIVEKVRNAIEVVIASEEYGCWIPGGSRKVNGLVEKFGPTAKGAYANWAAFKAAVAALNEKRNQAVFISDPTKVSPTVRETLDRLDLNSLTIRVCPIDYRLEDVLLPSGKTVKTHVAYLVWPKGTVHGASRFHATNNNAQCQACGHAIKNPFNWVPVLVDNKAGVPHSVWVGRDCAEKIFGIKMVGALILAEGQR